MSAPLPPPPQSGPCFSLGARGGALPPDTPCPPGFEELALSVHTDMASVMKAMAAPESGLEVRDRMWLKITIPNAFLGMWGGA